MERKDIVLKNLAQEIKFGKHELLRINKLDQKEYKDRLELLDLEVIDDLSENLMQLLQEKDPTIDDSNIPFGKILLQGDFEIETLLDLIAKTFKAGNSITIVSELNKSNSYQFIKKALQSVLASQGHVKDHISFLESIPQTETDFDLCVFENATSKENKSYSLKDFTQRKTD